MPSTPSTSKKRSSTRGKASAASITADVPGELRDQVVLLLIAGVSPDVAEHAARERLDATPEVAKAAVKAAQDAIVLAADVDRRRELGIAIGRLNQLYGKASNAGELKTCLAVQRELAKLMQLYDADRLAAEAVAAGTSPAERELEQIAAHLRPLQLAAETYPLPEVARIAADLIRRKHAKP